MFNLTRIQKSVFAFVLLTGLGLLTYFILLPGEAPVRHMAPGINQKEIEPHAIEALQDLGYDVSQLQNRTQFSSAHNPLKELVHTRGRSEVNRRLGDTDQTTPPLFYWRTVWQYSADTGIDDANVSITITSGPETELDTDANVAAHFTSFGDLISLELSEVPYPAGINPEIFTALFAESEELSPIFDQDDPEIIQTRFDITAGQSSHIDDETLIITRDDAYRIGDELLNQTHWQTLNLQPDTLAAAPDPEAPNRLSTITYTSDELVGDHTYTVDLTFTSGGYLTGLDVDYELVESWEKPFGGALDLYRTIFIVLVIIGVLVLFVIRLNNQLIGFRLVLTDAIIFGFLLLVLIGSGILSQIADISEFNVQFLMALFGILLMSAITTFGFIPFGATTESLSHDAHPEKLHSLTLLRNGFVFNQKTGLSLLNGVSAGFAIFLAAALLYLLDDFAVFDFSDNIPVDSQTSPVFSGISQMSNGMLRAMFYTFFIIAPAAFFIFAKSKNKILSFVFVVIISGVVGGITPETSHGFKELAYALGIAIVIAVIITRLDVVSLLAGLLVGFLLINSQLNVLPPATYLPAVVVGWTFPVLLTLVALPGLRKAPEDEFYPDFQPDYLKKLAEEERIRQGHKLAREVHTSFLPQSLPQLPELDIAANCKPALDVGGDYYDFFKLSDNKLAVAIGDVSGKGIHAAFYMTLIKGYLQSLSRNGTGSAELLKSVHQLFRENARVGTFITLLYGIVDLKNNTFTFARAGHNPLLRLDGSTDQLSVYQPDGCAIGVGSLSHFNQTLNEQSIPFKPGDSLILFTDGYPETTNTRHAQLGDEAFQKIIRDNRHHDAATMIANINKEVEQFRSTSRQDDDMTLVVIKRR